MSAVYIFLRSDITGKPLFNFDVRRYFPSKCSENEIDRIKDSTQQLFNQINNPIEPSNNKLELFDQREKLINTVLPIQCFMLSALRRKTHDTFNHLLYTLFDYPVAYQIIAAI